MIKTSSRSSAAIKVKFFRDHGVENVLLKRKIMFFFLQIMPINKSISHKSIFHESKTNPICIN